VGPPKRLFAKRFVVNVRTAADAEAFRMGYLRGGAVLRARTSGPVGDQGCPGGWYELTTGGFACSGRDVIAFDGNRLPEVQSAQPDVSAPLPYAYGYCRRDNTPVYRNVPSNEEAARYEGFRIPGTANASADAEQAAPHGEVRAASDAGTRPPTAAGARPDAGAPPAAVPTSPTEAAEAGEGQPETEDAGPPTLGTLMAGEDDHEILMRRMMRGFYVSLDREFRVGPRRYWRTQQNEYVPHASLGMVRGSDFQGIVLDAEHRLPVGWVVSRKGQAFTRREDGRLRGGRQPDYHNHFFIVGDEEIRGERYFRDVDGVLYRARDVTRLDSRPRPDAVGEDEKWIDVDLDLQTLIAYEGDRPVFATLVSTGRVRNPDIPERNHPTPTGEFRITSKHLAATMDGDNAIDGPYSIQDVPWVMYFELAYAFHAAFWHDRFGRPKSHGCVNMAPLDARWLFQWTDPQVPEGWHGAYPTEERPGTRVFIRGETPRG